MKFSVLFTCIVIQWLCYVTSCCRFDEAIGTNEQKQVIYGDSVEIFCEGFYANDLEFRTSEVGLIPSEIVNETMRRLYLTYLDKGIHVYYCKNKATNKICLTRVVVKSVPANVTDFECKSKNVDVLNCSWSYSKSEHLTNFSLATLANDKTYEFCARSKIIDIHNYCSATTISKPRYRQQATQIFFKLKSCNTVACNEQLFTIDHYSIVKPDPIELISVKNYSHNVLLHWKIPNNIFAFLKDVGIDHKIEYQVAKIDNTSSFRQVDTSHLPPMSKSYKFLLDLPYAHMQYEVRIYIKSKKAVKDEFWSDFTKLKFYTASDNPQRPPDTVVGAFDQNVFTTTRRIYVYWKQLEEYEEAGANFTYKVVVSHQGSSSSKTLLADTKKSLSYVVIEKASLEAINIDMWSTNVIGSSENRSHLYIPPNRDTVALRVTKFSKLAYENGTYELSWVGKNNIDNYTIFWCQNEVANICNDRLNFAMLDSDKTSYVINLPKENRYQFAISANTGMKTSGMMWASCDISEDGIAMFEFPITLSHGKTGKTFVEIIWNIECTSQEGIITGYNISYCPLQNEVQSSKCNNSPDKSTVDITNPKQMQINLTDLRPHRTYQFFFATNTIYGTKYIANSLIISTADDTPSSPRNVNVTEVGDNSSLLISWDPPTEQTGAIYKYVIYNYTQEYVEYEVENGSDSMSRRSLRLDGVERVSNCKWYVAACSINCSLRSPREGIYMRTGVGVPSKLKPQIDGSNIIWKKPENPRGNVDIYQVSRINGDISEEIKETTALSYDIGACEGNEEKIKVRAVNYGDNGKGRGKETEYPGEWSDPITIKCRKQIISTIFVIVAVVVVIVCTLVIGYEFKKYRSKRKNSLHI